LRSASIYFYTGDWLSQTKARCPVSFEHFAELVQAIEQLTIVITSHIGLINMCIKFELRTSSFIRKTDRVHDLNRNCKHCRVDTMPARRNTSLGRIIRVSCAKTAEPIEMPFGELTRVGPRNCLRIDNFLCLFRTKIPRCCQ